MLLHNKAHVRLSARGLCCLSFPGLLRHSSVASAWLISHKAADDGDRKAKLQISPLFNGPQAEKGWCQFQGWGKMTSDWALPDFSDPALKENRSRLMIC